MTLKIGKRYIEEQIALEYDDKKPLPSLFAPDKNNFLQYVAYAAIMHILFVGTIYVAMEVLGIKFPMLSRPEWKTKDIEFILTENEAPPIDKNTKYRSDKNSRAGGIHDPNRKVSMPSPAPSPAPKQAPKQASQPKTAQKPVQTPPKQQSKPSAVQKPQTQVAQGISKPSKPAAPSQKPVLKPSAATPKPQMPKLAAAPSSPFKVAVPNTGAPVGKGFSTSSGASATGGGAQGSPSGSGSKGTGMPAPQFSTTRTASAGSGARTGTQGGTGRGGYGTGNMGNPGPGNPKGAPGIDAIKSPQWGPYMRALEAKIKQNWHPPKGDQSKRVVLLFKIGKKGELLSVRVSKTSGSAANDQAAISAVQMSAPFRALPPEFTGSSVEIDFTFDYNVLGASYR